MAPASSWSPIDHRWLDISPNVRSQTEGILHVEDLAADTCGPPALCDDDDRLDGLDLLGSELGRELGV
eukprot:gene17277-44961_t